METIEKKTVDLVPGDRVVWGDGSKPENVDYVLRVENDGGNTVKVHVRRPSGTTFFYAGVRSVQRVVAS